MLFDFKPLLDNLVVFLGKTLTCTKGKPLTTKVYITLIRILLFIGNQFSHTVTGVIGYNHMSYRICICFGLSFIWFFLTIFQEKWCLSGNSISKGSWLEWSHGGCKENICGEWQLVTFIGLVTCSWIFSTCTVNGFCLPWCEQYIFKNKIMFSAGKKYLRGWTLCSETVCTPCGPMIQGNSIDWQCRVKRYR